MPDMLQNAIRLHQAGQLSEALRLYADIVRREPANAQAQHYMGIAHMQRGAFDDALAALEAAARADPSFAPARATRAVAFSQMGRHEEALHEYDHALRLDSRSASVWSNRGGSLLELRRFDEALACFDRALAIDPRFADAVRNRGTAMLALRQFQDAITAYDHALALDPKSTDAHMQRGAALAELNRQQEAVVSYDRALALQPGRADIFLLRGNALLALGRYANAIQDFDRVLAATPQHVDALVNRGIALSQMNHWSDSVASFDAALALDPGHIPAHYNRGNTLTLLRRFEEAARDCAIVLAADPEFEYARGVLVWSKLQSCDWNDLATHRRKISEGLAAGKNVLNPQQNAAICESDEEQMRCASLWVRRQVQPSLGPLWRGERYAHDRIRVGYVSADFHAHATAHLMAGGFDHHDRAQFEIFAFSSGPDDGSDIRKRMQGAIEHFEEVRLASDEALARRIRDVEIDILIDLKGYTEGGRIVPFAMRAAPVQISYLGYPGTTGAEYMDYVIADRTVIPPEQHRFYTEKIVTLPHSYQCNDNKRAIGPAPSRHDAGLPEDGFVFCCFNANYKILPETFDLWMRILAATPGSVLWLLEASDTAVRNLRREAEARGVDGNRLLFAPRTELSAHLARLSLADLFLDTLPYNAHTTASDALWAGVPVLSLRGTSFAGRVAASLLNAVGLPEMVTKSEAGFELRACALARTPEVLTALKQKLAHDRTTQPLFDTPRFTRYLETAYKMMWERAQSGHSPDSFTVAP